MLNWSAGRKKGSDLAPPMLQRPLRPSEPKHRHERARLIEPLAPDPDAGAGNDRNVLLAADTIGHRRSRDRGAEVEAVHLLEGFGVISRELTGHVSGEQQAAVGAEHAGLGRRLERYLVDDLAGA